MLFVWGPELKQPEKLLCRGTAAILITTGSYLFVLVGAILVYGADMMDYMLWPVLSLLKIVPHYLIQRLDFFVLGLWIGVSLCPVMNLLYAAAAGVPAAKANREPVFRLASALFCMLLWVLVQIPQNIAESYRLIDGFALTGSLFTLLFALILWIGGLVHDKKRTS